MVTATFSEASCASFAAMRTLYVPGASPVTSSPVTGVQLSAPSAWYSIALVTPVILPSLTPASVQSTALGVGASARVTVIALASLSTV